MKKTWNAVYRFIADNPDKANNQGDVAELIGVTRAEMSAFFRGTKVLSGTILKKFATFFNLDIEDVKKEHSLNVEKYITDSK